MKAKSLVALVILIILVAPAFAGKPRGGGRKPPQHKQQGPPPGPPSAQLSWFLGTHLDHILGPTDQQGGLPRTELAQLRESFVDRSSKAQDAGKPMYQAAVAVCDSISFAMDEREKAAGALQSSRSMAGDKFRTHNKLGNERKDNDQFFDSAAQNQWRQEAMQLRQRINLLNSRERDAERAAAQAKAAVTPAPPAAVPH